MKRYETSKWQLAKADFAKMSEFIRREIRCSLTNTSGFTPRRRKLIITGIPLTLAGYPNLTRYEQWKGYYESSCSFNWIDPFGWHNLSHKISYIVLPQAGFTGEF